MLTGARCTLEVATQIIETNKSEANVVTMVTRLFSHEGQLGRDPLVLNDEFREGMYLRGQGYQEIVDEAFDRLPPRNGKMKVAIRFSSLRSERAGLLGRSSLDFAVSAEMHQQLKTSNWNNYRIMHGTCGDGRRGG